MASSVTQHGITWKFDGAYAMGRFVNGDHYVVASGDEVRIVDIEPGYTETPRPMNGSTINDTDLPQGFDGQRNYDASKNVGIGVSGATPLVLSAGQSLISTISNPDAGATVYDSYVQSSAVLTIVSMAPPDGSFRPSYSSEVKAIYPSGALDFSRLKRLSCDDKPSITAYLEGTRIPFLHNTSWEGRFMHPMDFLEDNYYWPNRVFGPMALMLHCDYEDDDLRQLAISYVQLGIDMLGILRKNPSGWGPDGGSKNGAKLPLLYAALLLDDADMRSWLGRSGSYFLENGHGIGNLPPDYVRFGEDAPMYINQDMIDLTNAEGWKGYRALRGQGVDYPYTAAMLGMPEWLNRNAGWHDCTSDWPAPYRSIQSGGGNYFVSAATAALLIDGGRAAWHNEAFFDYVKRTMAIAAGEPDPFGYAVVDETAGGRPGGFVGAMYDSYFAAYEQ